MSELNQQENIESIDVPKKKRDTRRYHPTSNPASKGCLKIMDRDFKAMEMKKNGVPASEIAIELGMCNQGYVNKRIKMMVEKYGVSKVEAYRDVMMERYEELRSAFTDKANKGDVQAAKILLEIARDQRTMMGLDAPKNVDINHTSNQNKTINLTMGGKPLPKIVEPIDVQAEVKESDNSKDSSMGN